MRTDEALLSQSQTRKTPPGRATVQDVSPPQHTPGDDSRQSPGPGDREIFRLHKLSHSLLAKYTQIAEDGGGRPGSHPPSMLILQPP